MLKNCNSKFVVIPEKPTGIDFTDPSNTSYIVSTYELKNATRRSGSFYIINENFLVCKYIPMTAGIFRFKVSLERGELYAALANGCLTCMQLSANNTVDILISNNVILLCVSVCENMALTTDNHGFIHTIDLTTGKKESFLGHSLPYTKEPCEVWNAIWCGNSGAILSGGEDGLLKLWDTRCANRLIDINQSHTSGVIFLDTENEFQIISGSYDEHIRRIDIRMFHDTHCEQKLGGGVWNIRKIPGSQYIISCMYGGWAVVNSETFSILNSNSDIGSFLLYDALYNNKLSSIISCTFNNYSVNCDYL